MKRFLFILLAALAILGPQGWAWTPSLQEQQVANLLITATNQNRPALFLDPVLAQVARARATDMAVRKYFNHLNPDGFAANYLVKQAGYTFPDWWAPYLTGTDNFIESIGAGYSTAANVWKGWMNSAPHRNHLLGLDPFFAEQTHYGVGYVNMPGSPYQYYWVVITAPGVCVLSPREGDRLGSDSLVITGNTPDGLPVDSVYAQIENLSGTSAPVLASSTNAYSSWSANLSGLQPGSNVIRVQAKDASSVVISEASLNVVYAQMRPLIVSISGSGTVSPGFSGTTSREVGLSYTIAASPAPGSLFAGWTGGTTSLASPLTFVMQEGLSLQANFVPTPFPASKGIFIGTAQSGTDGFLKVVLSPAGAFSGRIYLGRSGYAFTGVFNPLGQADVSVKRSGTTPLSLHLNLDTSGHNQITGTATDGAIVSSFTTARAIFGATNTTPLAGNYSFALKPATSGTAPPIPTGAGLGSLRITPAGIAVYSGQLPDNTKFVCASGLSPDGQLPLFVVLPARRGLLAGQVSFANLPSSDATGSIHWVKAPLPADPAFPLGFDVNLNTIVCAYQAPLSAPATFNLALVDQLGNPLFSTPVGFDALGKFQFGVPVPLKFSLAANKQTGAIGGSFIHPASNAKCAIRAVFLQKQNSAFGYFSGGVSVGGFQLTP